MKKTTILFIFILVINNIYSQSSKTIQLYNSLYQPIAFANISINSSEKGFYSNIEGKVVVKFLNKNDTLKISCIGYENKTIVFNQVRDTLFLEEKLNKLNEIEIKANYKYSKIGYKGKKSWPSSNGSGNINGLISGILIKNITTGFLDNIEVYINKAKKKPVNLFLLRIFDVDSLTGFPKNSLLDTQIFVPNTKKGWVKIEMNNQHIKIENGVFIAVESFVNPRYSLDSLKVDTLPDISVLDCSYFGVSKNRNVKDLNMAIGRNNIGWYIPEVSKFYVPMIRATIKY